MRAGPTTVNSNGRAGCSADRIAAGLALIALLAAGCSSGTKSTGSRTPKSPSSSSPAPSTTTSASTPSSTTSEPPPCPNPEGQACLGALQSGTYTTTVFQPQLTYTVPAGWSNLEDTPGNFLLVPPHFTLAGVNAGTSDFIGIYTSVAAPN